jgi:hypothetical protein
MRSASISTTAQNHHRDGQRGDPFPAALGAWDTATTPLPSGRRPAQECQRHDQRLNLQPELPAQRAAEDHAQGDQNETARNLQHSELRFITRKKLSPMNARQQQAKTQSTPRKMTIGLRWDGTF